MVSALASINEVNQHLTRLVLRWVTVSGFSSWCRTFIAVCDQSPRSTKLGHPFVGRRNEYQPKGGDALWLVSKGSYSLCVGGRYNCVIPLLHTVTQAISDHYRDKEIIYKALNKFSCLLYFTRSQSWPCYCVYPCIFLIECRSTFRGPATVLCLPCISS